MVTEQYAQPTGQVLIQVKAKVLREIPLELGLLAGDIVNNLRSVMDNAIYSIGRHYGTSSGISFPVAEYERDYPLSSTYAGRNRQAPKDLIKLPNDVRTVIQDVQPYLRHYARGQLLWMLSKLWNDDKHHSPTLAAITGELTFLKPVEFGDAAAIVSRGFHYGNRLIGETIIHEFMVPAGSHTDVEPIFSPKIVFDEQGPGFAFSALDTLRYFHLFIRQKIIEKLKPFF